MQPEWLYSFTQKDHLIRFFSSLFGFGILVLGDGFVLVRVARIYGVYLALALQGIITLAATIVLGGTIHSLINKIQNDAMHGRFDKRRYATLAAVVIAGVLLVVPGFVTDAVGFVLYLPPGRILFAFIFARRHGDSLAKVHEYITLEHFSISGPPIRGDQEARSEGITESVR